MMQKETMKYVARWTRNFVLLALLLAAATVWGSLNMLEVMRSVYIEGAKVGYASCYPQQKKPTATTLFKQ